MLNIVFFCLIFLFLGIIFSKIKIRIEKFELNINNANFNIKVGIVLFGFLKVFGAKLDKNGVKILWKKFTYEKIFKKSLKELLKSNLKKKDIEIAEKINFNIDTAKFTLRVGTEDMFITVFLVTFLSGIVAEILKKKIQNASNKNINYRVLPAFNKNEVYYEGKTDISIKTRKLGNLIFNK